MDAPASRTRPTRPARLRPGPARRRRGRVGHGTWRAAPTAAAASPSSSSDSFLGRLRDASPARPRARVSATDGLSMLGGGRAAARTAPGQHPAPGARRPPRLRDPPRAGPRRHGRRLPRPEHAHGTRRRSSRSSAATSSAGRGVLDRFLREIRSAAQLHHPNIVTAYSALRLGESLVLAMEYVEGLDLARLVKAKGPLPVANACYFVHQAALGLQHAHEHGMVHRDIKPANLMLAREGKKPVGQGARLRPGQGHQRGPASTAA